VLKTGPFTLAEARRVGVMRGQLRGSCYRRLGAGLYRWIGLSESPHVILRAMAKRLPAGAAFSGLTAAWLHGLEVRPCDPIEVTMPEPTGSSRRSGASVRRNVLSADQIVTQRGLPTTSALRTVVDIGGRDPLTEGVVAADLFLHARLVSIAQLGSAVWFTWPNRRPSLRWKRDCECSWYLPVFPGQRFRFPSVTPAASCWDVQTCFIALSAWPSSTQ